MVEQLPVKQLVAGSSPARGAKAFITNSDFSGKTEFSVSFFIFFAPPCFRKAGVSFLAKFGKFSEFFG